MRIRGMLAVIAGVGCCSLLFAPLPGIAGPNNGNQGTEDKAREAYAKHVKEAEQEHQRQERQTKDALFKSNVHKAIEHGHAQQHH